jgi:hypothetical protein
VTEPTGPSEGPRNLVERAAEAAMEAVDAVLGEAGARTGTLFLALRALDVPAGEHDAVSAGHGEMLPEDLAERVRDIVAFLVSQAVSAGRQIGVDVKVVPLRGGPDS